MSQSPLKLGRMPMANQPTFLFDFCINASRAGADKTQTVCFIARSSGSSSRYGNCRWDKEISEIYSRNPLESGSSTTILGYWFTIRGAERVSIPLKAGPVQQCILIRCYRKWSYHRLNPLESGSSTTPWDLPMDAIGDLVNGLNPLESGSSYNRNGREFLIEVQSDYCRNPLESGSSYN